MERKAQFHNKRFRDLFLIFIFFFSGISCSRQEKTYPQRPRAVPSQFYSSNDLSFMHRQDTVFYKGSRFSGKVFLLYPNKDTAFIYAYLNGLQEGIQTQWFPNGKKKEERTYVNGKKEGEQRAWWPNGNQKFSFEAIQDAYSGIFKQWYASGKLERVFQYKNGQEEGSEKAWWPDGKIRANYVIRNGEKYGLFGQKLCINNFLKPLP